jgi:dTDP-4-dehydrorhamnose reductase
MKALVLGATGMLGIAVRHEFARIGLDTVALGRAELDANDADFAAIERTFPEVVVNAMGVINRRTDRSDAEFLRVNSIFPRRLADWCGERGIRLIHVSTDCVFRGDAGPYDESARPDAEDLYGRSKFWGEPSNALVIRSSIIGPELENHYALLCWFLRQQHAVNGFVNHLWNGVTTLELAAAMARMLMAGRWEHGIRHVYGEDLTKFELLHLIKAEFSLSTDIRRFCDAVPRDTRLRTRHPDFLGALAIGSMAEQLQRLRAVSDAKGNWMGSES